MKLVIDIPDDKVTEVVDAICAAYGYSSTIDGGLPNPQTKIQFAREQLVEFIKGHYRAYKIGIARAEAIKNLNTAVDIT